MKVVGAVIRNRRDEFLLQQRDGNAPSFRHYWTLFGGVVEAGETPEHALRRELMEELRLPSERIQGLRLTQHNHIPRDTEQFIFELTTDADVDGLELHEGEAMAFVAEADLFNRQFAFNIEQVLRDYLAGKN